MTQISEFYRSVLSVAYCCNIDTQKFSNPSAALRLASRRAKGASYGVMAVLGIDGVPEMQQEQCAANCVMQRDVIGWAGSKPSVAAAAIVCSY